MITHKKQISIRTNPRNIKGNITKTFEKAEVVIGLAGANIIKPEHIKKMAKDPIVFALANPEPEISPEIVFPLVRILATGRSDYPNQINNMLAFPGLFRGLLNVRAKSVNNEIFFAAAKAIAYTIKEDNLNEEYIVPSVFNEKVVTAVTEAVTRTAKNTGLARE